MELEQTDVLTIEGRNPWLHMYVMDAPSLECE